MADISVDISRGDYLWITKDMAQQLAHWASQASQDQSYPKGQFLGLFGNLEKAFGAASTAATNWGTPADIFEALRSNDSGIVGVGDLSVAFTEAVIAGGRSRLDAMTALSTIADGVKSLGSLTSTIISIVQVVMRLTSLDVTVRGFVVNASNDPLTYLLGNGDNPHLENCANVTGPLGTVLPGRRQIADPDTGQLVDCVAMSPWSITNDKGHTGAFATVIAEMKKPDPNSGCSYVALGWGVPYSSGPPRTTILPTTLTDAGEFYNQLNPEKPLMRNELGLSNVITEKDSLNTSIGRFVIFYDPGAEGLSDSFSS